MGGTAVFTVREVRRLLRKNHHLLSGPGPLLGPSGATTTMGLRRKNKSPPVLSHEFVIQNHADAVSCLAMGLLLGLMFEVTAKYVIIFITVQYNVTYTTDDRSEPIHFYEYGPKDIATIFFYMLIAIILHAVIQEYILDKINRRLHLSKTKHSKFNESGQLAFFYLFSFAWGASILTAVRRIHDKPYLVMERLSPFSHVFSGKILLCLPDCLLASCTPRIVLSKDSKERSTALRKIRKEDIPRQLYYICLYIAHICGAYVLKFTFWALLFVMARLLTLTLSVLTFGFGLARVENPGFSIADGNFNVLTVRISCLAAICLTQAWMMWKFINFQLKKWREHIQNQIPKKKITCTKSKSTKKEPNRANFVNGAVKLEDGASPRTRKSKVL
ncbi:translocating chain-associated membrane protein 1-like 1 isoform X2 [Dermochelys coriacea]|uniref:translocating chain-associated membrane protein 1-like 1 isoform X2 n=1 Tax=Dermochelys coriacea TaxID=27794 RepID=UPI001CA89EAD|nr:translocating chain-associated membrane protein 1-like 1 isoform X2 [Dermochelys coriacea]